MSLGSTSAVSVVTFQAGPVDDELSLFASLIATLKAVYQIQGYHCLVGNFKNRPLFCENYKTITLQKVNCTPLFLAIWEKRVYENFAKMHFFENYDDTHLDIRGDSKYTPKFNLHPHFFNTLHHH